MTDRSAEDLDPNDRYSDWTGPLEPIRKGPEKRELAAKWLEAAGRDPEIEAELERTGNEERAIYYFGFASPVVARIFTRDPLTTLRAAARVGVPFRGSASIPACLVAPGLASPDPQVVDAVLSLMSTGFQVIFSEPATGTLPESTDWRVQAFAALSHHRWDRLSELLDSPSAPADLEPFTKILLPWQMQNMTACKRLARMALETDLAALQRDISKAGGLAERMAKDPESAPAILDALFHRRFELASPPPYASNNKRNAEAVLQLFRANREAFARALAPNAQRRRILVDLFLKGFGYKEGPQYAQELEAAIARIQK